MLSAGHMFIESPELQCAGLNEALKRLTRYLLLGDFVLENIFLNVRDSVHSHENFTLRLLRGMKLAGIRILFYVQAGQFTGIVHK